MEVPQHFLDGYIVGNTAGLPKSAALKKFLAAAVDQTPSMQVK